MRKNSLAVAVAVILAAATAACGQGSSDNVMSPEANALEPADVNAALGPELTANDTNLAANDMNALDNGADTNAVTDNSANTAAQ